MIRARIQSLVQRGRRLSKSQADYYRLRTEWLRFKSHLVDSVTGLPTFAAVLEQGRRLLDEKGGLDVIYLDLGRSGAHEAKLGWESYDETVQEFAGRLGSLGESAGIAEKDIVCVHTGRSDRFLLLLGAPAEPTSIKQRQARVTGALQSRVASRLGVGHARVTPNPMVRPERSIQQAVADAMMMSLRSDRTISPALEDELARIIAEKAVRSVFHPIIRLADREIIGHEALTRPVGDFAFESVEHMFSFAESSDLLVDFERLCRETAMGVSHERDGGGLLFLNCSPLALEDERWVSAETREALAGGGLTPDDVVIEITERLAVERKVAFAVALARLKDAGFRLAVDDMGTGYASLQALAEIEPDYLKFDVSLVRDIHKSPIKQSLLESLRNLAGKIEARVIAEGIEQQEELDALKALGIELGQGFLFHTEGSS